ncbi:MAG: helix-turn-helix transcriptional regulator [Magnetococcales bacterium]|nr:helix-turn-helix transcriptional regulator [Magnetococcales bacterium]
MDANTRHEEQVKPVSTGKTGTKTEYAILVNTDIDTNPVKPVSTDTDREQKEDVGLVPTDTNTSQAEPVKQVSTDANHGTAQDAPQVHGPDGKADGPGNDFGAKLRAARAKAGLSQEQLAVKIGMSQAAVSSWEGGKKSPDQATMAKLIEALPELAD